MNFNSRNPMLGESAGIRDDLASFEINVDDDTVANTTFAPFGTNHAAHQDLSRAVDNYTSGTTFSGCKVAPVGECLPLDILQLQDVEMIINRETGNVRPQDFNFNVLENSNHRCTTHTMIKDGHKNDVLVAMPDKDIPIEVTGARGGQLVKVMLRYSTGPHYDMPVQACRLHEDVNDPGYSYHVPILGAGRMKDRQGHLSMEIPVPYQDAGNFNFSVVFRCLNSCHKHRGKKQTMILQLCDVHGNVLKEKRIPLRVCKNVNRDSKVKDKEQAEKHPAEETEEESPKKKVKKEVEEGSNKVEPEEVGTSAPVSLLPCAGDEKSCCLGVRLKPSLVPFFVHMIKGMGAQCWLVDENAGSVATGPPYGTF